MKTVQGGTGTGINPWWHYQTTTVAGGAHAMVNVGTGNMVLQEDDMSVPHKGIALAFRRTYNSQSLHDVSGTDGTEPSMYGNGWTSSFDAHITGSSTGTISVWDVDGARYDYTLAADGVTRIAPPGQYATLVSDGGCGYLWTRKSGTSYYFWTPDGAGSCPSWWYPSYGAYAGRTYQIIGRNRNTYITFNYSWDSGNSAVGGKISQVQAVTESGLTATMSFADVSGHRLLQQLVFPDGVTSTVYGYDSAGNLTSVGAPANNAAGTRPYHGFGYQALGAGTLIYWVTSQRWTGTDGGYTVFGFAGSAPQSSTVSALARVAVVNPTVPDGTGTGAIQPAYPTGAVNYETEWYGTGGTNPWFHDSDGHSINWVTDSVGRATQTQQCTATSGWTCTGIWLVSNETWDVYNNLVTEVDPRGFETDYLHDPAGNTTVIGQPQTATSQGTFKPTKIFDYDSHNNIVGYCDESQSHAKGADWVGPYASVYANDSLCATYGASVSHWQATYTYPSYEPYGELTSVTTPMGYTRQWAYAASQQAGTDYGLATSVTGASFTQVDGSSVTPSETYWYDANGYARCFSKGRGIAVQSYDALGRTTSIADPDDSSANASSLCGKSSGQPGWNTQTTYAYYPNGALQSVQSPAERAGGVASSLTYDADGNPTTATRYFNCTSGAACTAGVWTKWYDGADRLVEVSLPHDPSDYYTSAWLTRYLYDLSAGGSVSMAGMSFQAYGNVFKTQEWVPGPGATAPSWVDLRGSVFDALDRVRTKYSFSPSSNTTLRATTYAYDATTATLGMVSSMTDPLGETTAYTYDGVGHTVGIQFSGDGGVTQNKSFTFDADGRPVAASGAVYGTQSFHYDADGRMTEVDEPTTGSTTSPARLTYDYYPNGDRKDVNVISSALNASPLMSYAYRVDGARAKLHVGYGQQQGDFTWAYTDAGRPTSRTDPYTGTAMPNPQAPVSAGTVYAPTSWSYDATGQTSTFQLPETLTYTFSHDDEGQVTGWTAPSRVGTATMTSTNTIRGENVRQTLYGGYSAYRAQIANGATVRLPGLVAPAPGRPRYVDSIIDPTNGVVTGTTQEVYALSSGDMGGFADCGLQTTRTDYDAAAREVSTTSSVSGGEGDPNCNDLYGVAPSTTPLFSYDAENHPTAVYSRLDESTSPVNWDSMGHPYVMGSSNLHYDGGGVLFTTTAAGALFQVKIEALADIDSSGHMLVLDRDYGGQRITEHDNVLYGSVGFGSTAYRAMSQTSTPYVFPGSTNGNACTSGTCPRTGDLEYNRVEGLDFAGVTFQGARAVDTASGQWTTPDAFSGIMHDPMSAKRFMWDRNNPYGYQDPSGYAPNRMAVCEGCWGHGFWSIDTANAVADQQRAQQQLAQLGPEALKILIEILLHDPGFNGGKFTSEDKLKESWRVHQSQFPGKNIEWYEKMVVRVLVEALRSDTGWLAKVGVPDSTGSTKGPVTYIWNRNLGVMAEYNVYGQAISAFSPKKGIDEFNAQPGTVTTNRGDLWVFFSQTGIGNVNPRT